MRGEGFGTGPLLNLRPSQRLRLPREEQEAALRHLLDRPPRFDDL